MGGDSSCATERAKGADAGTAASIARWLFGGMLCLYLLLGSGHIDSPDGVVMSRVTASLVDRGRADIEPLANWPAFGGSPTWTAGAEAPVFYAKYGLGQSLVAIPGLLLGRLLAPLVPEAERGTFDTPIGMRGTPGPDAPFGSGNPFRIRWYDWTAAGWPEVFEAWTMSWTNAAVVAATLALLFLLGCEMGFGTRGSLGMALVAGLATPLAHYARTFFAEPLAGLGLVAFLLCLVRASRRERGTVLWWLAGLALGLAAAWRAGLLPVERPWTDEARQAALPSDPSVPDGRQLQFTTPGGTRIVWVLYSEDPSYPNPSTEGRGRRGPGGSS